MAVVRPSEGQTLRIKPPCNATLARFQVDVAPGSLMAFAPSEPIRCDVSSLEFLGESEDEDADL